MSPTRAKLPKYLDKYVSVQRYEDYTSRDHAAWRYIMRQNREFFGKHAVPMYIEGLKKTGITIDRIPRISEMDDCLAKFGWGAVPVRGFIPPAAFLEFQARGVLPIACDMRTVQHIDYTPAPDIVHEAAGHAPIIADIAYAKYLRRYAEMAQKAISSIDDIRTYEAIRYLSDIKENPDTPPGEIQKAEKNLREVGSKVSYTSENSMVTRMAWWTVEYGLVGDIKNPQIYGAGLLSSVGESQNCLSDKVKKIPLSLDCVNQSYDITEPQPQLFVAPNIEYLSKVLEDLENTLSFRCGGAVALRRCQESKAVNTLELDSGLQISGVLENYLLSDDGRQLPEFVKFSGPVQLCLSHQQFSGQGTQRHPTGYSSPLGRWKKFPSRTPQSLTAHDLDGAGYKIGSRVNLEFVSGFRLEGQLNRRHFTEDKLAYLTFTDCRVTRGSQVYFEPAWGEFDLAVGEKIVSGFGGPADITSYGFVNIGETSSSPARTSPYSSDEKSLFVLYDQIRQVREKGTDSGVNTEIIAANTLKHHPDEWLLQVELLEISAKDKTKPTWVAAVQSHLEKMQKTLPAPTPYLIQKGLQYVQIKD